MRDKLASCNWDRFARCHRGHVVNQCMYSFWFTVQGTLPSPAIILGRAVGGLHLLFRCKTGYYCDEVGVT